MRRHRLGSRCKHRARHCRRGRNRLGPTVDRASSNVQLCRPGCRRTRLWSTPCLGNACFHHRMVRYVWHHRDKRLPLVQVAPSQKTRGLTPRSSGAPTACRAGHQAPGLRPILRLLSSATYRCRPLSSNVRPGDEQDSHARLAVAAMGCAGTASSHGIAVRFGNRRSARGFGMHQSIHPVRSESSP